MEKCNICGENNFLVTENMTITKINYTWRASLDENGVLQCYKPNSVIEIIMCAECGTEFTEEEFKEVNFN